MENKLRTSGFVFAGVFFISYFVNVVTSMSRPDPILYTFTSYMQLIVIASILLFLSSAIFTPLRWLQPAVFLISSPIAILPESHSIYGLGYFVMGVLTLERAGFFVKRRGLKILILAIYLLVIELAAAVYVKKGLVESLAPTFFILAFGLFLWFLYKDRLVIIMKEPKARLSLGEKGLSVAERVYFRALSEGKGAKEISFEFEVAESTVRNTLARSYKKLGIDGQAEALALSAKFELVD